MIASPFSGGFGVVLVRLLPFSDETEINPLEKMEMFF